MMTWLTRGLGVLAVLWNAASLAQQAPATVNYPDMCDASAAIALDENLFIVANDEDSVLRVYQRNKPGKPELIDLSKSLKTKSKRGETDIEGVTRIGKTIYWITSHAQNSEGEHRPDRHRLFATDISVTKGKADLKVVGFYSDLRNDMIKAPTLAKYKLADAAKLAPEAAGGFNIEGLAAMPDGKLLIGFRNPIVGGSALLVPLDNPEGVIKGDQARFGEPYEVNLGGRGVRSIEYSAERRGYLIVAGPTGDDGTFALYPWSGERSDKDPKPFPKVEFQGLNPEAMFVFPGETTMVQFLSDDGGVQVGGEDCKDAPRDKRSFRSLSLDVR